MLQGWDARGKGGGVENKELATMDGETEDSQQREGDHKRSKYGRSSSRPRNKASIVGQRA